MESSSRPQGCENCHQECTIHLTQIVNNQVIKVDLCASCPYAQKMEQEQEFGLIDKLVGKLSDMAKDVSEADSFDCCPDCGLTEQQFRKTMRMGCSTCYTTFSSFLDEYLLNLHPGLSHRGKIPKRFEGKMTEKEINTLKKNIQEAIIVENYELAAQLRDKIKELGQPKIVD